MSLKTKNNHNYESTYDSSLLRGIDDPKTPRPWDLFNEIKFEYRRKTFNAPDSNDVYFGGHQIV